MTYYLILDSDYPPEGGMLRFLGQSDQSADLLGIRNFKLADIQSTPSLFDLHFVVSHDVNQLDAAGGPLRPAAVYEAV